MPARWLHCAVFLTTGCVADSSATLQRSAASADRNGDALFTRYRQDHGIAASEAEIDSCRRALFDQDAAAPSGSDSSSEPEDDFLNEFAQAYVIDWKTSRQMYHDYGGTVIFQHANPLEPIGAYRAFLKEQEQSGAFQIYDADRASAFWACFTNSSPMTVDPARVDDSRPWWESK